MKKKCNQFVVLLFCFFYLVIVHAFGQTLPFKHYTVEEGLAASVITCIFQDSKGYLWIGTYEGISRFNGIEFHNFYDRDGLISDYIKDIHEDKQGIIWIATMGGGIMSFQSGKFKSYTTKNGLVDNRVNCIVEDQEGNLWLGTSSGLSKFNGRDFINFTKKNGLIDERVNDIILDEKGAIWIATEGGLGCLTKDGFMSYTTAEGLINNNIRVLMMDGKGNLWIGTRGGLSCFHRQKKIFRSYTTKDGIIDNHIFSIIEDWGKNIWIGTQKGISIFSREGFSNYNTTNGLPDDKITAIFHDRERNLWFGSYLGLSQLHSLRFVNFSQKNGLPHNLVWTTVEDKQGRYWFGTDMGLSCYAKGKFENFTTRDGLVNNSIYKLIIPGKGNLFIGTEGGLSVYSFLSGKFKNYTIDDGLPHNRVLSLSEGGSGVTWIGTERGLYRLISGTLVPPDFKHDPLPIHDILKDKHDNVWYTNRRTGVYKISADGTKVLNYSSRDGLANDSVNGLFEDSQGRIWMATSHGLSCFNNGKFTNYSRPDGLLEDTCVFVQEDDNHYLWIGTSNGVYRFDGNSFRHYTSRDGLASVELVQGSCFKDSQGNLWFGTVKGMSRFNPKQDRVNTVPPPVYITNLQVMANDYPLPGHENLRLEHKQNFINFDFIGLSLTSPGDVIYKYQLEGIEKNWLETRNRNVSYHYLPPGNYNFKVIAVNREGIESRKSAEMRFHILPPFWETWWFRGLLVVSFMALIVNLQMWRVKRAKEKAVNQERNKQLVMAQKMELAGILAGGAIHDLKNLLSVIITYSKIAAKDASKEDEKNRPLETIKTTASTAIQVVKQILAFTRQGYDKTVAAHLPDLLEEIVEILRVTAPPGINIRWQPQKKEIRVFINPTRFQQMVMNLCLNAIQAMPQGGTLDIQLRKDQDKQVILEISDTGIGIEKEILEKIFDPLFTTKEPGKGTGLGLFVVKHIVDEYKGKIKVQSRPPEGTSFKISLPYLNI